MKTWSQLLRSAKSDLEDAMTRSGPKAKRRRSHLRKRIARLEAKAAGAPRGRPADADARSKPRGKRPQDRETLTARLDKARGTLSEVESLGTPQSERLADLIRRQIRNLERRIPKAPKRRSRRTKKSGQRWKVEIERAERELRRAHGEAFD